MRRGTRVTVVLVLLVALGVLGYGAAGTRAESPRAAGGPAPAPATLTTGSVPTSAPTTVPPAAPPTSPPVALLAPGDRGPQVRALQSRLRQLFWFSGNVTDSYGPRTTAAVEGFQAKRRLPVTGTVDARTLRRLERMTHAPTADELANRLDPAHGGDGSWTDARLDPRCTTGRALCIDKTSRTIRWVVDGTVEKTMAVRFGASYSPTREGLFHVQSKSRDHVSSLYGSAMPFAMFFSRGQAVHYSSDFAARGYAGASHGCVNVRDHDGIEQLFGEVEVGDKVVVYWS